MTGTTRTGTQPPHHPTSPHPALARAGLAVPDGWRPVAVRREPHDERTVTVVRYQPAGTVRRLGGEHVTVVVDEDGTLLGYTRLTVEAAARPLPGTATPDRERARETALDWLRGHAPGHARRLGVLWVDRHDETVRDATGARHVVAGLKVKTRHTSGLYTWVILDDRGEVLTYERDIRWDAHAGRRATEMWLHDRWIAAREGSGPQPAAPYALARSEETP